MEFWQSVALVVATVLVGLMAGLFWGFSVAVMPGLRRADDRSMVTTFQRINVAIVNPVFLAVFLGALLVTGLAGLLPAGGASRPWIWVGFGLYLATLVVTIAVHIPLNNQLDAAGPADNAPDLAGVRARFERRWVRWNLIRTLLSTGALACLAIAWWQTG